MSEAIQWMGGLLVVICLGIICVAMLMALVTKIYTALTDWGLVCEYIWYRKRFKAWLNERKAARQKKLADVNLN